MKFKIDRIFWIGTLTLIGFPLLGFVLLLIFSDGWASFIEMFSSSSHWSLQFVVGAVFGVVSGMIAWLIIKSKWMRPILMKYGHLVQNLRLSTLQIVFLSFCAGAGEEILFRGALQPFWGVWITAIFFVAIHGYLNFKDVKIFVYGVFMTVIIAVLGWMNIQYGLLSAITAHMVIDVVLFYNLTHTDILKRKTNQSLFTEADYILEEE